MFATLAVAAIALGVVSGYKSVVGQHDPLPLMTLKPAVTPAEPAAGPPAAWEPLFTLFEEETAEAEPGIEVIEIVEAPSAGQSVTAARPAALSFDGRPLRKVRTIRMLVTAYSPDERSCGKWADGRTASGYSVWTNGMKLVAADTSILPFGSIVTVPGYNHGRPVPVLDRGGAIKGHRLDVLYPTHEVALKWGAQRLDVDVWEYAD